MSRSGPAAGPATPHRTRRSAVPTTSSVRVALAALVVAVLAAACGGTAATPSPTPIMVEPVTQPPLGQRETAYDPPEEAPPLVLTDQDGKPFDLASLRGQPVFVYFGYTHCPDVCPTTLADIREGMKRAGISVPVVMVTIDPARDTAAAMKQYTSFYGEGFLGLTGSQVEINRAATDWGVSFRQLEVDKNGNYAMAHSTDTYLIDAKGMLRHHIFFGAGADIFADRLTQVAKG